LSLPQGRKETTIARSRQHADREKFWGDGSLVIPGQLSFVPTFTQDPPQAASVPVIINAIAL
jgi:hypothetical protein